MKTAIIGATSQLARALTPYLAGDGDQVMLFARNPAKLTDTALPVSCDFDAVFDGEFDLILNCIGAGTPAELAENYEKWFTVLEPFDNLALNYLKKVSPQALYISFSSGGVYGNNRSKPVDDDTVKTFFPNEISVPDYYALSKLYAEAKHRAHKDLRIVDLRIFSFFCAESPLDSGYFMTDLAKAVYDGTPLKTTLSDMVRDYPHPSDIAKLIRLCAAKEKINTALDVISAAPVSKSRILEVCREKYALQTEFIDSVAASPNQSSNVYYSISDKARQLCSFVPEYTSEETILSELDRMLKTGKIS